MADTETDVQKMKVADLKRELKLRGLSTNGNKTELVERLQAALLDGDLSLEDTAISGEDIILDDEILTDEEKEILSPSIDEKELLKSPTIDKDASILDPPITPDTNQNIGKKVVLKRKIISSPQSSEAPLASIVSATADEALEPTPEKLQRTVVPIAPPENGEVAKTATGKTPVLWTNLSEKERLEMRAKKFGGAALENSENKTAPTEETSNEKQIEALKKRAERFGCVTSSKIATIQEKERLEKRKERFGTNATAANKAVVTVGSKPVEDNSYAEKARQRLERFKPSN